MFCFVVRLVRVNEFTPASCGETTNKQKKIDVSGGIIVTITRMPPVFNSGLLSVQRLRPVRPT